MTDATAPRAASGFCSAAARPWILTAAILTSALGFIDGSVVSIAIPAMRRSLDAGLVEAQWIVNAYLLPLSALVLVGGAAGDRFGIARVLTIGVWIFIGASVVTALAPNAEVLIAARALKGIGAALMVPGSLALISRAYPAEERGRAIGIWAAASAVTTALGPILGGALLSFGSDEAWRIIFAINPPLGLFVIWLLATKVGRDHAPDDSSLDWTGAALATVGLGLLAWALSQLGAAAGPPALPLGLAGAAVLAAFVWWEGRARRPMMPLGLFRNPVFSSANIATFVLYFALQAVLFYLPMTVISTWGVTEVAAAAAFAPLSVFIGGLSGTVGRWADRIGPGPLIAGGSALVAVAFAGLALTTPLMMFWSVTIPLNAVMGLGMALVVGPLSTAVMAAAPETAQGAASGINNAVSRMAGLISVAAVGSLAALSYGLAGGPTSFGETGDAAAHVAATNAAFATVAWATAGMAALASVVAWFGIVRPQTSS